MSVTREQVAAVVLAPVTVLLDRELVRFFARTIGERGGVHDDLDVARASGHRDLVVPPTYFFTIENQRDEPLGDLSGLDLDPARILHGEQRFDYRALAFAGDTLEVTTAWTDAYEKGDGRLQFLVRESDVRRDGQLVARSTSTLVVPR